MGATYFIGRDARVIIQLWITKDEPATEIALQNHWEACVVERTVGIDFSSPRNKTLITHSELTLCFVCRQLYFAHQFSRKTSLLNCTISSKRNDKRTKIPELTEFPPLGIQLPPLALHLLYNPDFLFGKVKVEIWKQNPGPVEMSLWKKSIERAHPPLNTRHNFPDQAGIDK